MFSRPFDIRIPIVLLLNLAFIFMLYAANSMLAPFSLYLAIPALFLILPASFLNFGACMAIIAVCGFLCEAFTPVRAGLTPALWLLAGLFAHLARRRFRNPSYVFLLAVFETANVFLLVCYAFFFPMGEGDVSEYLSRMAVDAGVSVLALAALVPFTVALGKSAFRLAGIDLDFYGRDDS